MNAPRRRPHPLSAHDTVLASTLRTAPHDDPFRAALSVTIRGLDAGLSVNTIRQWLSLRDTTNRFARLTSTPRRFHPVASKARAFLAASSDSAAARERVAGSSAVLVGHLLSPVLPAKARGLSPHRVALARRALAVVGVDVLDSLRRQGWDSVLVSQRHLAVRLGCTPDTARSLLRTCVAAGWLSERSRRPGGQSRYALSSRLPAASRETAWQFVDAVDAVAEGRLDADPVADLVLLADHPAWGHANSDGAVDVAARRDSKVWLAALAMESGQDGESLGLTRRVGKESATAWLALLSDVDPDVALLDALDLDAQRTGADVAAVEAEARRAAAAEARVVEIAEVRARREKVRTGLDRVLGVHTVPKAGSDPAVITQWARDVHAVLDKSSPSDGVRRDLAQTLAMRMQWKANGYDEAAARRIARRIAGLPD